MIERSIIIDHYAYVLDKNSSTDVGIVSAAMELRIQCSLIIHCYSVTILIESRYQALMWYYNFKCWSYSTVLILNSVFSMMYLSIWPPAYNDFIYHPNC